jgi:hypothetical protein
MNFKNNRSAGLVVEMGRQPEREQSGLLISKDTFIYEGYAVAQLVEALRYKPEGRGFDSRWCHIFSLT